MPVASVARVPIKVAAGARSGVMGSLFVLYHSHSPHSAVLPAVVVPLRTRNVRTMLTPLAQNTALDLSFHHCRPSSNRSTADFQAVVVRLFTAPPKRDK